MKVNFRKFWIRLLQYIAISLVVLFFICRNCYQHPEQYTTTIIFTFLLTILLFEGNGWLNYLIGKRVSWVKRPVLRTVLGVGLSVIYSSLLVVLIYYLIFIWGRGYSRDEYINSLIVTIGISMAITLFISLALHARDFLFHWREAALRVEKLRAEQMNSRFSSLKAQLNPHFLFNSLNALTALVYKDPDQAAAFIKKLSEMYRYILEYVEEEVVSLEKELECLEAYIFLLKIRHGEHLRIKLDVEDSSLLIPPLSLQILLENATKHNIISQMKPLEIEVYLEEKEWIVVKNRYQPKEKKENSLGKGLKNIRARYKLLTEKEVGVYQNENFFVVKLPLLSFDKEKLPSFPNNLPPTTDN